MDITKKMNKKISELQAQAPVTIQVQGKNRYQGVPLPDIERYLTGDRPKVLWPKNNK